MHRRRHLTTLTNSITHRTLQQRLQKTIRKKVNGKAPFRLGAATPTSQQANDANPKPVAPNLLDKATDEQFGEGGASRVLAHAVMLSYQSHPIDSCCPTPPLPIDIRMQQSGVQIPTATKSIGRKPNIANQPYTAAAEYLYL
jgi:hypothetical protein